MHRVLLIILAFAIIARADELTRSVQNTLKEQGFFYGEATGVSGPETAAAVKRYQIRNGLEVTGTLTKETLEALGLAGETPAPAPAPVEPVEKPAPPVEPAPQPPVNLRKDNTVQEKDREFLRRETPEDSRRPPARAPVGPFGRVFAGTPYATAPAEVQQDTIKRAQRFLRELSFYSDEIDGVPGPALEEGLLGYQRFIALPLTGLLDLETLAAMKLLPGRGGAPAQSANPKVRTLPGKPLKGVWIR